MALRPAGPVGVPSASHRTPPAETVGTWLERARNRLASADLERPRLEAELLLAHTLGVDRAALWAHPERPLSPAEHRAANAALARRAAREPLAYIRGWESFLGRRFIVDQRVLIPRPETEELAQRAIDLALRLGQGRTLWVVDVGTGSGVLAISLALELALRGVAARVVGIDRSPAALEVAQANAAALGATVNWVVGDLLAPLRGPLDLVVANLPYVAEAELAGLMPEVARFEPRLALTPGADPLALNRRLLAEAATRLAPHGALLLELSPGQGRALLEIARARFPSAAISLHHDLADHERILQVTRFEER